jgi:hypothetical protein
MEGNDDTKLKPIDGGSNLPLLPIENLIHVIRGQQVMLDSDLARLYGVETRVLNQAVKRNIERFPEDFMFQLTKEESQNLISQNATSSSRSQNVTLNVERGKNIKYMPYAFTENGVAMLSSVLRSKTAIEVNIRIMRAFTSMRSFMMNNAHVFQRIETIEHNYLLINHRLSEHDKKFEEILTRLDDKESEPIEGFFFEGQIFDAYSLISDLIRKAKQRIILIDNYVDDRILKVLTKRKEEVSATIFTDPRHSQINTDLKRHNAQYPRIEVKTCTNVHDRFLIIDDTVYFIGGSIKDLGKKIVAFSRMHQNPDSILTRLR